MQLHCTMSRIYFFFKKQQIYSRQVNARRKNTGGRQKITIGTNIPEKPTTHSTPQSLSAKTPHLTVKQEHPSEENQKVAAKHCEPTDTVSMTRPLGQTT
jgi:hypothetical protein